MYLAETLHTLRINHIIGVKPAYKLSTNILSLHFFGDLIE